MTSIADYVATRITVGAVAIFVAMILYMEYLIVAVFGVLILYFGGTWAINHPELVIQRGRVVLAILAAFATVFYVIGEVAVRVFDIDPDEYGDDTELKSAK